MPEGSALIGARATQVSIFAHDGMRRFQPGRVTADLVVPRTCCAASRMWRRGCDSGRLMGGTAMPGPVAPGGMVTCGCPPNNCANSDMPHPVQRTHKDMAVSHLSPGLAPCPQSNPDQA